MCSVLATDSLYYWTKQNTSNFMASGTSELSIRCRSRSRSRTTRSLFLKPTLAYQVCQLNLNLDPGD